MPIPTFYDPNPSTPSSTKTGTSVCEQKKCSDHGKPTAMERGRNIPCGMPVIRNAGANTASVT